MGKESVLIIAGEKSGEEHCLSFFGDLKRYCPQAHFWGVGGDELQNEGMELLYHLKDFSSWGFSEVIAKIPFYFKALKKIEQEVITRKCKVAILIDFQDFNLRLAKKLNKHGVKVLYYVAPQAWAWKAWRARVLQETVHTLFTIIPFEKEWFQKRGVEKVQSVAHPLMRTYGKDLDANLNLLRNKTFESMKDGFNLLILPGSRGFEVRNLLPEFIRTIRSLKKKFKFKVLLVESANVSKGLYAQFYQEIDQIFPNTELHTALKEAHVALAASGTVTLATALYEVPTVVSYKTSLFNEFIWYTFVNYTRPFSLANIIHDKRLFPELPQEFATPYNMEKHISRWLTSKEEYETIRSALSLTKNLIRGDLEDTALYMSRVVKHEI